MIKNANFVLAFSLPERRAMPRPSGRGGSQRDVLEKKRPQGAFVKQGGRQIQARTGGPTMPCLAGMRVKLLFHMLVHNGVQMFRFVQTA
jgi:hypothetical protein